MFISVADAAVGPGELIKASQPAVYYLADDGKRYVFPNERIYFSWYEDFRFGGRINLVSTVFT